ncbi:MAG: phosphotransferase, partial [Paracoccaceae bacterium]
GSAALFKTAEQLFVLCKGPTPPAPLVKTLGPVKKPCLIHADMVAGNIIVGPEGLRFIDWQCPAVGDPAEDLAMFLSPAMQALYRGKPLQAAEAADFLNAYPDQEVVKRLHELLPLFHYRMAAYCLWRAQNGFPAYKVGHDFEMAILARLSD